MDFTYQFVLAGVLTYMSLVSVHADDYVKNEALARQDWRLQCQGCHGAEARGGNLDKVPNMFGILASFLKVEGGRQYLTEVPGVVAAPLSNERLADLMNWMMREFDGDNLPMNVSPFTAEEMKASRDKPMVTEIMARREALIAKIEAQSKAKLN